MALDLSSLQALAFGTDPRQRVRLQRLALSAAVYVGCLASQWDAVRLGLADRRETGLVTLFCLGGLLVFVLAIRTGATKRLADAALTMPQMVWALLSLALGYHGNPMFRASILGVVPLVLVFGAFILPARLCVRLGWFAVAVFGVVIGYGAWTRPDVFVPRVEVRTFGFIAMSVPALAYLVGQLSQRRIDLKAQKARLRDAMERLTQMATHDALTGLPNRRHVDERIADVIVGARRDAAPLCVAILDLDRFKRVNDQFGHAAGDEVLRVFAVEAARLLREADVLARWGGEEFLLVLPGTGLFEARVILERMRKHIAASSNWRDSPHLRVTFSAGLALLRDDQTLQQALQCADFALYDAKNQGRDRTVVADPDGGSGGEHVAALPRRMRVDHPTEIF